MVKINAMVTEETRKALRLMAAQNEGATAQAITAAAIDAGLKVIRGLPQAKLRKILQPDGRRNHSSTNGHKK